MPYIMGDDDKKIRFLVIHWLLAKGVRSDARSFFHVIPSVICHLERPLPPVISSAVEMTKGLRHIEDSVKLTLLRVKWEFTRSKVPLYDG